MASNTLNAVRRVATAGRRGIATYSDVVPAPPSNRISFFEKCVHGAILSIGILGYPIYSMFEVAKIRQAEYDQLEIPEKWQQWLERQKK